MLVDLFHLRNDRRLTLRDLAEQSGVAKSTIGAIESGRSIPRLDTVCMLARALDMTPGALFEVLIAGEGF